MSGGSYDYLFCKSPDELMNSLDALERMTDALVSLGYSEPAAETYEVIKVLKQAELRVSVSSQRLSEVWRSVEWYESGDFGEEGPACAYRKYLDGVVGE